MNDRAKAARGARSRAAVTTLLQSVCDRLPVAFALFDADLELAAWNARLAALGGYPRKLVKAGTPLEAFVRFDVEREAPGKGDVTTRVRKRLAALRAGKRDEREQPLADGRVLAVTAEAVPDAGVLLTCEDITAARHTEERLRETAASYELALRGISEGFYDWDIAHGTIDYSERVRAALGFSPAALRTVRDWRSRIHPDDLARYDATHVAHFKGKTERFECDYRFRGPDGSWRWARQHGVALRDARGRAYRMVGSTGDITELKRVEEALRASEARYALAMRAAVEGIYEWNVETNALFLSDQARAFFAFPAEELGPQDWNARIHPDDFAAYRRATIAHFKGWTPHLELEYRIRDATGDYRWVLDRGIGLRNAAGRVTRLVGALSDVTERKLGEAELHRARDEAKEALARQTALREVLEAISRSAFDLDAVLRTLIEHATRLGGAEKGFIFRLEGDIYRLAVDFGVSAEFRAFIARNPIRADSQGLVGLTVREGRTVHIEDATTDPRYEWHESQRLGGFRTMLGVPLLRDGAVIGVIALWKERVEPFSEAQIDLVTAFSNQALIAIENARLFRETSEALEQQTATAEILRGISSSPTDLAPVYLSILSSITRLCEANIAALFLYDGEFLTTAATHGTTPEFAQHLARGPFRPSGKTTTRLAALERRSVHVADLLSDPAFSPEPRDLYEKESPRTVLSVPLLRDDALIGVITTWRREVRPFSDKQVALVRTFANQAVIAIENLRLFNETREALEQQTATAETLRVISSSPTDLQPVFEAIVASATRLCESADASLYRVDGDFMQHVASHGVASSLKLGETRRITRGAVSGRSIIDRQPVHVPDLVAVMSTEYPDISPLVLQRGIQAALGVPLLRDGVALGSIVIRRLEVGPFSERHIALLQTFADQAVIAIENVRLFNETREALEQQTATAEILKVISSSPTDVQPVFDAIANSGVRLFQGVAVTLRLVRDDRIERVAFAAAPGCEVTEDPANAALPLDDRSFAGRAVLHRELVHVPDIPAADWVAEASRTANERMGARAIAAAPMLRESKVLGVIAVTRAIAGPFSDRELALLTTFADQAVIAIQNVRLFNETKEALDQQRASAEVLSAISSSIADARPVFDKILERCQGLFGGRLVGINLVGEDGLLALAAYQGPGRQELERVFPLAIDRTSGSGRSIVDRCVIHYPDAQHGADVPDATRRGCTATGIKSVIFAPMLWQGRGIGTIFLGREHTGSFSEKEVALLKTFADQAVIAIQNARLFNETKEALDQQTATADILKVMSSSPTDVQPVFEAIVRSGIRLFENAAVAVVRPEGGEVRLMAIAESDPERAGLWRGRFPFPLTRDYMHGAAILDCRIVDAPDVLALTDRFAAGKQNFLASGYRAMTVAPMVRDGVAIGTISVIRMAPGPLTDKQLALLKTFADQAVIAIENVRLFNETNDALEQQKASAEVLGVISSSVADTQPVFDKILESCARLFEGRQVGINLVGEDGAVHLGPYLGPHRSEFEQIFPVPLSRESASGSAILERRVIHYPDVQGGAEVPEPVRRAARRVGFKSAILAPMLWEGRAIGTIFVNRDVVGPFSDKEIGLLKTFADQAVIAIQNARLFNETKDALEQQKASAEVLQVISSSVADTKPVFDKILESCERLFEGRQVGINLVGEDGAVHLGPYRGPHRPELESIYPLPLSRDSATGSAILERRVMHYPDVERGADVPEPVRRGGKALGFKSVIFAPMLWEARGFGAIFVWREFVGPFSEKEIALLKTFADQAVIAIQNARLFQEIQEKSHQLEIAGQHKSAFLANMSHELRTPLNAVIGFSEMLAARYFGELTEKQAEYVSDIHGSGKHLLSLINDILDLSKIEAGRMELELTEFDLGSALDNALTLVRERAQRGGVALRLDTDPRLQSFRGDERKLKQVVLNLLSNAVKFTPSGGSVSVVAKRVNGSAEIAVSDTGVGIAPADQEAIFEAFRQVGTDATRKREGTGLGLALARRFVELHGGTIRVASAPGKGSTFTVTLPIPHGE